MIMDYPLLTSFLMQKEAGMSTKTKLLLGGGAIGGGLLALGGQRIAKDVKFAEQLRKAKAISDELR